LGRSLFLIGFDAGDTNLYRYVNNSPTNFTDPSGMTLSGWGEDLLNGVDSLAAGFANVVTFGLTNKIREVLPNGAGKIAKLNQEGLLYNIGSGLGLAATLALNPAGAGAGWAKGLAAGYEGVGTVYGVLESTGNILKGEGSAWDALNFIPVLQLARASKGSRTVSSAIVESDAALTQVAKNTQCFVAGTEIQTLDGTKNIEDIHVGDWVLSDDPNTVGEIEYKQVLQTFVKETTNLVDIYIDGEKITTTEEHPFWVPDVGWVAAKDLHAGSLLQTKYESWLDVDKVVKHSDTATVYNFEVEGFHTYFVSDLGLLVHNECKVNNTLFRGDDSYKQGDPVGWKIGSPEWENAKIQTPWEHVNNNLPEPSSQKSRFTSFAQKVDDAITFTDKGKVLKIRLKDLQEVEGIEIYTPERVKQMMKDASMKSKEINAIYNQMIGNSEILVEGEIPASLISLAKLKSK
jgi:hypothetical protein